MGQKIKVHIVNAFAESTDAGSPTGVVPDAAGLSDKQMQYIASRVPASHTCFVTDQNENIGVRFFTVNGEVPNCGHGSIALHYLRAKMLNLTGEHMLLQQTKMGSQKVDIVCGDNKTEVYLSQNEVSFELPSFGTIPALLEALNLHTNDILTNPPVMIASPGTNRILLGVSSATILNNLQPDFEKLKSVCAMNESIGCFVYSINHSAKHPEATARMFAPSIGVDEDIINGNSSGCLGAYLFFLNRKTWPVLHVRQGHHFNREGMVIVKVGRTNDGVQTVIGGTACIEKEVVVELA